MIDAFVGQIATLAVHEYCHLVLVTALEEATDHTQAVFIEEVCTVSSKEADMAVMKLTGDKYGHVVVLAMLKVSRHKQVHNLLKASILCKQDEETEKNEYGARVVKAIKTEYHRRVTGNYAKC